MHDYLKNNDISIKNGTDVNSVMRDMMSVILEDVLDEKLDKVVEYQEAQQAKPERLLDKLKENSFWLVLAAVLGAVLARVGL